MADDPNAVATLIALGGLPGSGKTTVAMALRDSGAVWLRIDTIEMALWHSVLRIEAAEDAGYLAAAGVARDNLVGDRVVVADSVNPVALTRAAWAEAARAAGAGHLGVEILCSDPAEHRRRVETRRAAEPEARYPSWSKVRARRYDPWPEADLRLDTAAMTATEAAARIRSALP